MHVRMTISPLRLPTPATYGCTHAIFPAPHVVIRSGGQPVDPETLHTAAQLAAYYSQRRGDSAVPVAVTPRRFVTRVAGGRPGQVHIRQEETVVVPATMPAEIMRK